MKIATRYNRPKQTTVPTGKGLKKKYHMELDKTGHKFLVNDEPEDIYALIQSHAEEVKIENIIARAMAGDNTALNKVQGQYMDTTKNPKNLADLQNTMIKMRQDFEKLPVEIKQKFDNDYHVYISTFGTTDWENKMGVPEAREKIKKAHERAEYENELRMAAVKNLAEKKGEKDE